MFPTDLHFHGDLPGFLHPRFRTAPGTPIRRDLRGKTSVKDVIEACGIPHTEVDLITVSHDSEGVVQPVDFHWPIETGCRIDIYPAPMRAEVLPSIPRLQIRRWTRFVADGHLGKLARNLRLLGFDTAYERHADDRRLLEIMAAEDRALLTRDRPLLMHSTVQLGYCPRSDDAEQQTREVLARFSLGFEAEHTFSRCLACNGFMDAIPKCDVRAALGNEPLTLLHYDDFYRCAGCGKIFWRGTHFEKLVARIARLSAA